MFERENQSTSLFSGTGDRASACILTEGLPGAVSALACQRVPRSYQGDGVANRLTGDKYTVPRTAGLRLEPHLKRSLKPSAKAPIHRSRRHIYRLRSSYQRPLRDPKRRPICAAPSSSATRPMPSTGQRTSRSIWMSTDGCEDESAISTKLSWRNRGLSRPGFVRTKNSYPVLVTSRSHFAEANTAYTFSIKSSMCAATLYSAIFREFGWPQPFLSTSAFFSSCLAFFPRTEIS